MEWVDFDEVYDISETECTLSLNCPSEAGKAWCIGQKCAVLVEPELHATGGTPLGRSLFYAGEILRHLVVAEGRPCSADSDCGSPHYTCVEGACRDPYRACRPNLIVMFTDGGESFDNFPETFFHPQVQAKRLHYGLGCTSDADCLNGAACVSGICELPEVVPSQVCHLTDVPCSSNLDCPCARSASK